MNLPDLNAIKQTHDRIKPYIHRTPVLTSSAINQLYGADIFFKCENFQKVGAFKARGAFNTVLSLSEEEAAKGVATHSSGNHAAAMSYAAKVRGIPAYVVMPNNAPAVKKAAVEGYGAKIVLCEPNLKAREAGVAKVIAETGATLVPPYNDNRIITGQATAAVELLEEVENLDIVVTPVGGGGILSGTALAAHYISPKTKVIAGEPAGADDAYRSFVSGKLEAMDSPDTIADGLRVSLGELSLPIIREYVSQVVLVSEDQIISAMRDIWERMKIIIEPSSAVALATLKAQPELFQGKKVGIILTGGNVDLQALPWCI